MAFKKTFVRVESLALDRAFELRNEAGFNHLYLTNSQLASEKGWAAEISSRGQVVYDEVGKHVGFEASLRPRQFGLDGEVEALFEHDEEDMEILDNGYFIQRQYWVNFNDPQTHDPRLFVSIVYAKKTEQDDWTILVESVWEINTIDGRHFQAHDPVIYRAPEEKAD